MKKFAIVEDNIIVSVICTKDFALKMGGIEISDDSIDVGDKYIDGQFVKVGKPTKIVTWDEIRQRRDELLCDTDWTQLSDCQLSEEEKEQYRIYRQALRDLPQQYENPNEVVWPEMP